MSLVRLLLGEVTSVTADRKEGANDKFDDITERNLGRRVSRQLKWTESDSRSLQTSDFTDDDSSVRIDKLVIAHRELRREPETDVRLAVRWGHPATPDLLEVLVEDSSVPPTFEGSSTKRFTLRAEEIWPAGSEPRWPALARVQRDEFMRFAEDFTIETGLPESSRELASPGELERYLLDLLANRVGVGQFPNHRRTPEDVAARLIQVAATARADGASLTADEVAGHVHLQRDFGHVVQDFPFRVGDYVERGAFKEALRSALESHRKVLLVGPPGSGKSWELTTLAQYLVGQGHLVARHYCYISPDDEHVELRITADVMYGNLIQELLAGEPRLLEEKQSRFAATAAELQHLLRAASRFVTGSRRLVVIVDGLDHIARVAPHAVRVAAAQLTIAEDLAALDWPLGTCLVVGSQPGDHLSALLRGSFGVAQLLLPPLDREHIDTMARTMGLVKAAELLGDSPDETATLLAERADGNALYATMLIRGATAAAERGVSPAEYLRNSPAIAGDLNRYYAHLYEKLTSSGRRLAELLGVLDFSVTRDNLVEILGPIAARGIDVDLRELTPLLLEVAGRGGVRIFHESFRRYIIERDANPAATLTLLLGPVVAWLERLGFYQSGLAFRYMLPTLARAGRIADLLRIIDADFVANAVAHCHPRAEIERNLDFAMGVAGSRRRLPELIRIGHLHRAAQTCFEEHLSDPEPYWRAHLALYGAAQTSARLAPDGQPSVERHLGLRLCSRIADAGESAPWSVYLALPRQSFDTDNPDWASVAGETLAAMMHGLASLEGTEAARQWAQETCTPELPEESLKYLALRWTAIDDDGLSNYIQSPDAAPETCAILASVAAEAHHAARPDRAAWYSDQALRGDSTAGVLIQMARLGMELDVDPSQLRPEEIDIWKTRRHGLFDEAALADWLQQVELLAFLEPARVGRLRDALPVESWYWCWLRFCTHVFDAERAALADPGGASRIALLAFRELARDTHPFRGDPRAVDLYGARNLIRASIARGLRHLLPADWSEAVGHLERAVRETTTYLQRSPTGPISSATFLELLEPHVGRSDVGAEARSVLLTALQRARNDGQLYSIQAELELIATRCLASSGQQDAARERWVEAARLLTGYGFRKDITIFELIDSIPSFSSHPDLLVELVERIWPLTVAVVSHTDGKGTKHSPNALLATLAEHAPAAALSVAVDNMLGEVDPLNWVDERAFVDAVRACAGRVDPRLRLLSETTVRFELEAGDRAERRVKPLVAALTDAAGGGPVVTDAGALLVARVEGDPEVASSNGWSELVAAAAAIGVRTPDAPFGGQTRDQAADNAPTVRSTQSAEELGGSVPPAEASLLDVMAWVRHEAQEDVRDEPDGRLLLQVGYRCVALWQQGMEEHALRLLYFAQRAFPTYSTVKGAFFESLAEGFQRYGLQTLACRALVLAFAESRGGNGWHLIGDEAHEYLLDAAEAIDSAEARAAFEEEIVKKATGGDGFPVGVTEAVVSRLAAWDVALARTAWQEAFAVVQRRLPTVEGRAGWLPRFERTSVRTSDVQDALVAAVAARCSHPEADRRTAALLAFAHAVQLWPSSAGFALKQAVGRGPSPTASLELLQVLWEAEAEPFEATKAAQPVLEGACHHVWFGIRVLARMLLARAGLAVPIETSPGTPSGAALDPAEIRAVRDFGGEERVDALAAMWPGFPSLLAGRFRTLRSDGSAEARHRQRVEYSHEDGIDRSRWIPLVHYLDEQFTQAVHECANGILPHLLSTSRWKADAEHRVLTALLPDLRVQLGVAASRVVRPPLAPPADSSAGVFPLQILPDDEPCAGWIRVALFEREYTFDGHGWRREPKEELTHVSGMEINGSVYDRHLPFAVGKGSDWSVEAPDAGPLSVLRVAGGPVVGLLMDREPPAMSHVALTIPIRLAMQLGLRSGPWPGPLCLVDSNGSVGVRFRAWEVGGIRQGERPSRLSGCDLLMRQDLVERLAAKALGSLVMVHRVQRCELGAEE